MKLKTLAQDQLNFEMLRLHFARYCWRRMNELTPSGRVTWSKRFEEMFSMSLREFAKKQANKDVKKDKGKTKTVRGERKGT